MKKVLIQGVITVSLFFATWFALTKVDWINIFKVKEASDKTEKKLGELFWNIFEKTEKETKKPIVVNAIDSIVTKICAANNYDRELIKLHIIEKDDINAFALPDGHLIVYTGLILNSENPEELSGVVGHEMAHIFLNHVMKKLVKEIGLSVLISMTTGNSGSEIIQETAKMLSSSAFDRTLEKEADIKSVDLLLNAKINPEPFADFLYKLAGEENESSKYFSWISTHPDSKERAEYILEYCKDKNVEYESALNEDTWQKLIDKLKD